MGTGGFCGVLLFVEQYSPGGDKHLTSIVHTRKRMDQNILILLLSVSVSHVCVDVFCALCPCDS